MLTKGGHEFLIQAIDCFLDNKSLTDRYIQNIEGLKKIIKVNIKQFK